MKQIASISLFFLLFIFHFFSINAQQIPNSSFENWEVKSCTFANMDHPRDFNTVRTTVTCVQATAIPKGVYQLDAADAHSGNHAIRLKTVSALGREVNGTVTTGTINTTDEEIEGGLNYTWRPDSLIGWYKYFPSNTDTGVIRYILLDINGDSLGEAKFNPVGLTNTYTRFTAPIKYKNSKTPSKAIFIMTASERINPQVGSELIVDDVELIFNSPTSVNENSLSSLNETSVFYHNGQIAILNAIKTTNSVQLQLFSLEGKLVLEKQIIGKEFPIASGGLNGVFIYQLKTENSIQSGKILIY